MSGPGYIREIFLGRPLPEDSWLNRLPALAQLRAGERLAFDSPVTFLVGENGAGKSTLLEGIAVACGFNPEGGTRNFSFSTRDTHSALWEYLTISRSAYPRDGFFLRAESFYNAASYIDRLDEEPGPSLLDSYGGVSLHAQSHGESFLALVQNRFGGEGLYLLTSRRPPCPPRGSSPCWGRCACWRGRAPSSWWQPIPPSSCPTLGRPSTCSRRRA